MMDVTWGSLGWGMVVGGAVLLAVSLAFDAPGVSAILSVLIVLGGFAAVIYDRRSG